MCILKKGPLLQFQENLKRKETEIITSFICCSFLVSNIKTLIL
jgi:hypothetical protein